MTPPARREHVRLSYRAIHGWARIAVSVFYRRVQVTSASRLPQGRPVILAANHGNALGDVAVIIAEMPEFPHFLAAATWWKFAPARMLFGAGGVVPIHRRRDGESTQQKQENSSAFEACHEALASGAQIAIFPEGEMHLEPALLPLKTGAARIALSAVAEAGLPGVVIVPVGLVYDDRGRFRSDAEIHFGEPIEIDEWTDTYRADPAKAVRGVTDLLADRLAQITVNHGSSDEADLLDRVAAVALADAPDRIDGSDFARRNALRRALAAAVALAGGESSVEYRELVDALDAHGHDLERLGLDARDASPLGPTPAGERSRVLGEVAALAPPAALGLVAHAPVLAALKVASMRVPHEAWQATVKGVGGTVLCPLVWAGEFAFLSRSLGRRRALVLTTAGVAGGVVALAWRERFLQWRRIVRRDRLEREQRAALDDAQRSREAVRFRVESLVGGIPPIEVR